MTSDGNIDNREIKIIENLCAENSSFQDIPVRQTIQILLEKAKIDSGSFIRNYLKSLENIELSSEQERILVDFALNTILADNEIEYSEIKFFKKITRALQLNKQEIIKRFPDFEMYLEDDITAESNPETQSSDFWNSISIPIIDSVNVNPEPE